MVRKLLLPLLAAIVVLAMVVPGCNGTDPVVPVDPDPQEIEIIILTRTDLPPNPVQGRYVADQLRELGFKVTELERDGAGASPIWIGTHPREGAMSIYTGGWSSPSIPRDQGSIFDQMYTHRVMGVPLWGILQAQLEEFPELNEASEKLRFREFANLTEREALFGTALEQAHKFSNCLWTIDTAGANPYRIEIGVGVDAAGGIGDPSWVHTIHKQDIDGNVIIPEGAGGPDKVTINMAQPSLFLGRWNPVEGSEYTYDMVITRRALGDAGTIPDPREGPLGGIYHPLRVESATVYVEETLPVGMEDNWNGNLALEFRPEGHADLTPPDEAWADWDADEQEWITVAEREIADPEWDREALRRSRVVYPADIFDVPLHDGSTLSMADFMLAMIMTFDRGKEGSSIFDEDEEGAVDSTLARMKGIEVSFDENDQLVIDYWTDMWYLDADWNVTTWFPQYGTYGWTGFWHMVTAGWVAESIDPDVGSIKGTARGFFSEGKAIDVADNKDLWLDYVRLEDTLDILEEEMLWAKEEGFIPYRGVMEDVYGKFAEELGFAEGQGVAGLEQEIDDRWLALEEFYGEEGHFWVGNGPFKLGAVDFVGESIELLRFDDYSAPDFLHFADNQPTNVGDFMGTSSASFVDQVIITKIVEHAALVTQMQGGFIDLYTFPITDPGLFDTIDEDPGILYNLNYGGYRELRFNTYRDPETLDPFFENGMLNPFAIPAFREAMNWVIDRDHIVETILGGLGAPKYTVLGTAFPDYAEYVGTEANPGPFYQVAVGDYQYDMAKAEAAIAAVFADLDAREDLEVFFDDTTGTWWFTDLRD